MRALFFATGMLLFGGGCGDPKQELPLDPAALFVDARNLNFGPVRVGTEKESSIRVRNDGLLPVSVQLEAEDPDSEITATLEFAALDPGQTGRLRVLYAPTLPGEASNVFQLSEAHRSVFIAVQGFGSLPRGSVTPSEVDFATALINTEERSSLTLQNLGAEALEVTVLPGQGTERCQPVASADFCVETDESGSLILESQEVRTIGVRFHPMEAAGARAGGVQIRFCQERNDSCRMQVSLRGYATREDLACRPSELDFGRLNPGSCWPKELVCQNLSNRPVLLMEAELDAGSSPAFELKQAGFQSLLPPGQSQSLDVFFCPDSSTGAAEGQLRVVSERDGRSPRVDRISLVGQVGGPDLVTDSSLMFGTVSIVAPAQRSLWLTNAGDEDLVVSKVEIPKAQVSVLNASFPMRIEPLETRSLIFEVQAEQAGLHSVPVVLTTNDQDSQQWNIHLTYEADLLPPCLYDVDVQDRIELFASPGELAARTVHFRSTGREACQVTTIELRDLDSESGFRLDGAQLESHRVEPDESSSFRITFQRRQPGREEAILFVGSTGGLLEVPVIGTVR